MNKHTHEMLARLTRCLIDHAPVGAAAEGYGGTASHDAEELRRISMTLHRWHELECGDGNDHGSWAIVRGHQGPRVRNAAGDFERVFTHDDDGKPFMEHHHYTHGKGKDWVSHNAMNDREAGALKRLVKIMARYPALSYYVQTDPRGCALYILRPGDVPAGASLDSCYSNGVAVFK